MSPALADLEMILRQLVAEHEKLLAQLQRQLDAMRALDLAGMQAASRLQEATRMRIASLESRRRLLAGRLAGSLRSTVPPTLAQLAEAHPQRRAVLLALRQDLTALIEQVRLRAAVAAKLAAGVLGYLNTVVRVLAGAVEQSGTYTKQGIPRVTARIGAMEAVG